MARFDIYPAPEGAGWLLDVQADLLDGLNTRVVVPLLPPAEAPRPARRLNPVFSIDGQKAVMVTQFLSAVPAGLLRQSVGSVADRADEVTAALDMLFSGY